MHFDRQVITFILICTYYMMFNWLFKGIFIPEENGRFLARYFFSKVFVERSQSVYDVRQLIYYYKIAAYIGRQLCQQIRISDEYDIFKQ